MRLVIFESPYAGDVEANTEYARRCVRDSLMRGEAPIASHLLYTQPGILHEPRKLTFEPTFEPTSICVAMGPKRRKRMSDPMSAMGG